MYHGTVPSKRQPPRSAVANLHTYVSGLRTALPPVPDGHRVRRHPDGYSISLLPGELDLRVFEELIERSARCAADGRTEDAAGLIEAALALWRGDPAEDLPPSPLWQAEAVRLVERRLGAVEELCALRLGLGRHTAALLPPGRVSGMQGTVASYDALTRSGTLLLDDGSQLAFPATAFDASGLRLVRPGQRVRIERDESGQVTKVTLPTFS